MQEKHNWNGTSRSGPSILPFDNSCRSGADFDLIRRHLETLIALAKQKGSKNLEDIKLIADSRIDSELQKAFDTLRDMAKLIELARQQPQPAPANSQEQEDLETRIHMVLCMIILVLLLFLVVAHYFGFCSK